MPLPTAPRLDIGLELQEQRRKVINDAFFVTLFQILVDAPQMTATEALIRAQEKGALVAPAMGRQQSELLGPLVERELDILARAGALPPMPDELAEAGGEVRIEYQSPLNRAQRADEGVALLRTLEGLGPLIQADPTVLDRIDPDEAVKVRADVHNLPAKVLRSDAAVAALREARTRQQQQAAVAEAAPGLARAVRDVAELPQAAA
jgi:hypothetical protein